MKICNADGCGVCYHCDGTPPVTNGYSHGDICRKTVENIMNHLKNGEPYRFVDGKLYQLIVNATEIVDEKETKFGWEYSCNIFKIDPLQKLLVKEIKIASDSDDDLTDFDLQTKAGKLLEDYVKNHPGEYEATIVKSYKMKR